MQADSLSAREAAEILGVKLETLYAYVSRGLLKSVPGERGRARRYLAADVEALRSRGRRSSSAASALRWGEPVLESGITAMTEDGPAYRGRLAAELAATDTPFESVAELLWTGTLPETRPAWPAPELHGMSSTIASLLPPGAPPSAQAPLLVAALAARDPGRFDIRPAAVLPRARALTRALALGLAVDADPGRTADVLAAPTVAESIVASLGCRGGAAACRALDRALVLLADHELNASTFAARIAASTHADVYACLQAGLATLSGPLHGAASDRVEALLSEIERPERAEHVLHERQRRGERIPGFGHPYYPKGDPRARLLLEAAWELGKRRELDCLDALVRSMELHGKPAPNVDVGIVGVRAALGMPKGAAAGLFSVARSAGWVAHVLEQYASGSPLRPRARYRPAP